MVIYANGLLVDFGLACMLPKETAILFLLH